LWVAWFPSPALSSAKGSALVASDDSHGRRGADPRESIGMEAVDRDGRIDQRRHVSDHGVAEAQLARILIEEYCFELGTSQRGAWTTGKTRLSKARTWTWPPMPMQAYAIYRNARSAPEMAHPFPSTRTLIQRATGRYAPGAAGEAPGVAHRVVRREMWSWGKTEPERSLECLSVSLIARATSTRQPSLPVGSSRLVVSRRSSWSGLVRATGLNFCARAFRRRAGC